MDWTFIWLMFVLKIPIVALLWIVWWAVHATPDSQAHEDHGDEKDGGSPKPKAPRPPRTRGPHGEPMPPGPQRSRPPGRPRVTGRT